MTNPAFIHDDVTSRIGPVLDATQGEHKGIPILVQYWRVALRWKWVIAAIMLGALATVLILTFLKTPIYTAVATIEIARQQDKVVNVEGVQPDSGAGDMEFYQTQYALLKARSLAERVADSLRLSEDVNFFQTFGVDTGQGTFLASPKARTMPVAQADVRKRIAASLLLSRVGVSPVRGSRLVQITFSSPDPELSRRVANAWTDQFIESTLDRRLQATTYARKFLEDRLAQLRQRLEEAERQAVNYASDQRIINIPTGNDADGKTINRPIEAENLTALNAALGAATADRVRAESRMSAQRGSSGSNTENSRDGAISAMRQQRSEAAANYAKMLVQFEPDYPPAKALAAQIAQLDRSIAREEGRVSQGIEAEYREAAMRESSLQAKVNGLKNGLLDLRRRSIQYNIYQRDADTTRQLYDGLLQRYKEIGIAGGVGTNNVAIVDPALLPTVPSSPNLTLNLLLALFAGVVLAAAVTFALEQIDEMISDPTEVVKATQLPLLGTTPSSGDEDPLALLNDRKSGMSEAYMSIQTTLQFATDHGVPRSLTVTSTRASEGKSTTSFAIAKSLSRTGRRVVLIDGDMRSPSVHRMFDMPNTAGVSNFLSGDDALDAMIVRAANTDLVMIPAGPMPPNAAELLSGPRLQLMIARLLEKFDHVVVDSPPVLGLADAPLISSQCEGVIYAVQARGARASLIRAALQRLRASNAVILGVVLTKFEAKKAHYGYGYDYGYGYGNSSAE